MADSLELTYYYGNDCGVCAALRPKIRALADRYQVVLVEKFIEDYVAEAAQRLIFSVPAVYLARGEQKIYHQMNLVDLWKLEQVLAKERM